MRIDFTRTLQSINGVPLALEVNEDGTVKTPATLGSVATTAVMAPRVVNGETQAASGPEALRALSLSLRIYEATEPLEITAEDVVYLKERIAEHWTLPIVVGRAWQMLEGA
ncbi:hypothetical protein [Aureimonas phyllosphaerae]|uniref:Uncharacterized protein n=1 Tax=Aureimonas phyllosphaerae TaxID=1166078 RepID=A0A7W6BUA3_9HYPH|nr:hypothetical protein [Aureimonas phyllosphaerae]MBB3938149.1 hypothetical protein [Aureimonas phyllosphaerae]MBB3962157.1 hypothetical protein [Aureimonas phyllosphaerae]SFF56654.1 hypothetical protein SAMN05216566_13023 [Aureimonas phyllosphaerae]